MEKAEVKAAMAEVEQKLGGNGRILLRPSGTEPLVRVMIEGKDPDQVAALCRDLADVVEKAIA
jgi:phosphoglucosamine mutase